MHSEDYTIQPTFLHFGPFILLEIIIQINLTSKNLKPVLSDLFCFPSLLIKLRSYLMLVFSQYFLDTLLPEEDVPGSWSFAYLGDFCCWNKMWTNADTEGKCKHNYWLLF